MLNGSNSKPNKILVNKGREFYNKSMKSFFQNNDIEMYHEMKPVDKKSNRQINSNKEINNKDPKFKAGDIIRIPIHRNIFANVYTPNWFEEDFVIKKVKSTVPWTYAINDLNEEEIVGTFYENELQKLIKRSIELKKQSTEKVINFMLNLKDTIICLIAGKIKKTQYK